VDQPDVVLFLTDDMRADDWPILEKAQNHIGGTWFPHFCYDMALCAPTRATVLTGRMTHHHGVRHNSDAGRKFARHESDSLAPAVHAAGYSTAYADKYINIYDGKHTPPGWDHWRALAMAIIHTTFRAAI
jgi:N-acetylglucosamine-6-sulfatase